MTEKRYELTYFDCFYITDRLTNDSKYGKDYATVLEDDLEKVVEILNEQDQQIKELKRMLQLVSELESVRNENSVKEIVRNNLFGLDSVAGESANAFNDYLLLNKFFKEYYNEQWDNGKFD